MSGLKDRVAELEGGLGWLDERFGVLGSKQSTEIAYMKADIKALRADIESRNKANATATCHICGKRDFMDNLADVGWMGSVKGLLYSNGLLYAHPDCAGIRRSDDGKGWTKCKCKGKK
jgi:hypothetical protein